MYIYLYTYIHVYIYIYIYIYIYVFIAIQVSFCPHFVLDGRCGINDWEIALIDKGRYKRRTREK